MTCSVGLRLRTEEVTSDLEGGSVGKRKTISRWSSNSFGPSRVSFCVRGSVSCFGGGSPLPSPLYHPSEVSRRGGLLSSCELCDDCARRGVQSTPSRCSVVAMSVMKVVSVYVGAALSGRHTPHLTTRAPGRLHHGIDTWQEIIDHQPVQISAAACHLACQRLIARGPAGEQ